MILAEVVCNRSLERSPAEDSLTKLALSGWLAVTSWFMFLSSVLLVASGLLRSKLSQKYLGVSSALEACNEFKEVAPVKKSNI